MSGPIHSLESGYILDNAGQVYRTWRYVDSSDLHCPVPSSDIDGNVVLLMIRSLIAE